ncbi:MAG: LytR C-terminal domain-containing protein [Solirubrobacteraceae bacterium]
MTADASAAVRSASGASARGAVPVAREPAAQAPARTRGAGDRPPSQRSGVTTYSRRRRSPARATLLIGGAVVIGAIAVVLVVSSLGSSSGTSPTTTATTAAHPSAHHTRTSTAASSHPSETSAPTVSPAEAQVAVLNGTGTPNLAHRLSASLQQSGYSQATPLSGTPPGSHQTTVVEYTSGHRVEAARVAQALGVTQVQPIEAAVSPLAGSSTVVVIAGLDKAGAGGEASSSGAGEASSGGAVP